MTPVRVLVAAALVLVAGVYPVGVFVVALGGAINHERTVRVAAARAGITPLAALLVAALLWPVLVCRVIRQGRGASPR